MSITEIHAEEIDRFQDGKFRLMRVTRSGSFPAETKEGTVSVPFHPGFVLIAGAADEIIVGPLGLEGIADLAERIMEGDQRSATDPTTLLSLCAAILGFRQDGPPPTVDAVALPVSATVGA